MAGLAKVVECLAGLKQDPNPPHLSALADAVQQLFQEGLVGNRTVNRGDVWGLVTAATRAFPIQLSPSVEKAQEVLAAGEADGSSILHTWIIQAAADGSLPVLVQKLRSQPQILTAYARDATLRQAGTTDKLVSVLQELQDLIPVSPYDKHLQAKAAVPAAPDQPTVHIQTELDLARQQQQQQQPSPLGSPASSVTGGSNSSSAGSNSSSSSSGQGKAASAGNSATGSGQHDPQPKHQQGLVGRLRSARLPQLGSFTKKGSQQQQRQQHCAAQLLKVQLKVSPPQQHSSAADMLVQLHIQVVQPQQQQKQHSPATGAVSGSSDSSTADTGVPPSGSSVKGLLHGLHQSAASGLQQAAATAASQDLSGAVAAAGGAVAAAFGSVKGLQRFKTGSKQQEGKPAAARNGVTGTGAVNSSKGKAGSKQGPKVPRPTAAAADAGAAGPLVAVQLLLRSGLDAAAEGPVQLQLTVLPAAIAAADTKDAGWSSKGMLGRLRLARGSGSTNTSTSSSRTHSQQQEVPAEVPNSGQQQQGDAADPLEGDMWSVMSRLKASSTTNGLPAVQSAADTAAEAMAQQLQESGAVLQEQLVSCCKAVCTAASSTKGSLGEESPDLLQLIQHSKGLLNHGLGTTSSSHGSASGQATGINSSSRGNTPEPGGSTSSGSVAAAVKAAATARDMLGGLLMHGRQQSAFGVLQALQHGSKQQPRLMLGADGIANMKAARSAPPATKLDLWVRASLNEQLLGVRVSTLLANPDALKPWYHPQALLLQHGPMAAVMQELQELSQFRFALPVDAAAGVSGAPPSTAAMGHKAGAAVTQSVQQQSETAASVGSSGNGGAMGPAHAAAGGASSSRTSSMAAALDPRKYFGSFSAGLGPMRGSSATAQAPAAVTAAAGSSGSNAASSSNPAIPTFLWGAASGALASTGSITPPAATPAGAAAGAAGSVGAAGCANAATAAAAAVTAATAATGGFFRRRRVPQIKEVLVPAPGSGAVLSREPSSTLSPMSTEDEAAYAEWWSPNNGSQDLSAAVAAVMDGSSGSNGAAQGRRPGSSNSLRSYGSTGGQPGSSSGTPRSPTAAMATAIAAGAGAGVARSASRQSRADSEVGTGATSEAALQLEHDLQAAMSAPLLVEQFSSSRRSSSGHGGSSSGSSGGGAGGGVGIRRSGSAGWDAAVAAARARSRGHTGVGYSGGGVGSSVGLSAGGLSAGAFSALSRRSKSPEADVRRMGEGAGGGVGGGAGRRPRHMHKRSSSLNDLPELEALWMDGGGA